MIDITRYGQAEIGGGYYLIRQRGGHINGADTAPTVATVHIDGLGNVEKIATAAFGTWSPEQIAKMPTLIEAMADHLAPAFAEALANQKKWTEAQEKAGRDFTAPPTPRLDPATARFLDDGEDADTWIG